MKTKATQLGTLLLVCLTLLVSVFISAPPPAQAQTFYIQSQNLVPFPFDPYGGAESITTLDAANGIYRVNDNTNDWELLMTARELDAMSTSGTMMTANDVSIDPGGTNTDTGGTNGGGGSFTNYFQPRVFGPDDLWIQITNVDEVNQQAFLRLHNTVADDYYQLLSTNVLSSNGNSWTLGEIITGTEGTNLTDFSTFNIGTNSQMFFRAHHTNAVVYVVAGSPNAIEPNPGTGDPGQVGHFTIYTYLTLATNLAVNYSVSGTAQEGIDYSNLSGVVTLSPDITSTNVNIIPIADNIVEGSKR